MCLDYWVAGNQKTSNVMDHAILAVLLYIVLSMTACSYMIRFNMYLDISVTGQCETKIYLA